jgi:hypothetical protein
MTTYPLKQWPARARMVSHVTVFAGQSEGGRGRKAGKGRKWEAGKKEGGAVIV